jgi:hypothetical protein
LKQLFVLLIIISLFGCGGKSVKNTPSNQPQDTIEVSTLDDSLRNENQLNSPAMIDTTCTIKFDEFQVTFNRLVLYESDVQNEVFHTDTDTLTIYPDYGEMIEGQLIYFEKNLLENIQLEQRYETSLTINNEGPHCDLVNWEHHTSEWKVLKPNKSGVFKFLKYSDAESRKFPEVSISELKNAVKNECGAEWVELINEIKTIKDSPCFISINRYYLKISGIHKRSKKKISKVLVFEIPMGC